jgi:AcrR family transcriptional regulator
MPRPKGSPNDDFAASRAALLLKLRKALLGPQPPSSLRALAQTADVAVPTLRHYFGDKDAVLAAVFADCHGGSARELQVAATPTGSFKKSILDLVQHVADGFRYGKLDSLHAVGLTEGLAAQHVAQAYLNEILEPTIAATTMRLQAHIDRGEMRVVKARHAAVALLSPIVLLFLHQNKLNGAKSHPTDIEAFLVTHVDAFVRGYAPATGHSKKTSD